MWYIFAMSPKTATAFSRNRNHKQVRTLVPVVVKAFSLEWGWTIVHDSHWRGLLLRSDDGMMGYVVNWTFPFFLLLSLWVSLQIPTVPFLVFAHYNCWHILAGWWVVSQSFRVSLALVGSYSTKTADPSSKGTSLSIFHLAFDRSFRFLSAPLFLLVGSLFLYRYTVI